MSTRLTGRAAAPHRGRPGVRPGTTAGPDEAPGSCLPSRPRRSWRASSDQLQRAEGELRELAVTVSASAAEAEAEIFEAHADFATDPEMSRPGRDAFVRAVRRRGGGRRLRHLPRAAGRIRERISRCPGADLDDVSRPGGGDPHSGERSSDRPESPGALTPGAHAVADRRAPRDRSPPSPPRPVHRHPRRDPGPDARHPGGRRGVGVCWPWSRRAGWTWRSTDAGRATSTRPTTDVRAAVARRAAAGRQRRAWLHRRRSDVPGGPPTASRRAGRQHRLIDDLAAAAVDAGAEGSACPDRVAVPGAPSPARPSPSSEGTTAEVLTASPVDGWSSGPSTRRRQAVAFVDRDPEANPALGVRGIRLRLAARISSMTS